MMGTQPTTLAEFLEHPHRDSHRLELLDGEIYQKPPLDPDSSALASRLGAHLDEFGFAGVEARVMMEGRNGWGPSCPIPDVAFFMTKPQLKGDMPKTPPQLIVDIVPPKRNRLVTRGRVETFLAAGTGAIWVVDIERRCVEVYENGGRRTLSGADRITAQAVAGLAVPVSTLFLDIERKALTTRAA
ncbi:MAG TPA: Uma2 family endonuclease [Gemmatimonadales bacterium]|nr:Uma2 family endonuclease [Gemmatimonadales bacterium]